MEAFHKEARSGEVGHPAVQRGRVRQAGGTGCGKGALKERPHAGAELQSPS